MLLLAGVALIYFLLVRQTPVAPVVQAVTAQEAAPLTTGPRNPPASSALKQPLDCTRAALGQVRQRNGDGEF